MSIALDMFDEQSTKALERFAAATGSRLRIILEPLQAEA